MYIYTCTYICREREKREREREGSGFRTSHSLPFWALLDFRLSGANADSGDIDIRAQDSKGFRVSGWGLGFRV